MTNLYETHLPAMLLNDHRSAIRSAREWLSSDLVVFDTETTGFAPNEIVEIGAVDKDGEVLLDTLVKPVKRIEPSAYEVHGISDDDCKDAPTITDILPQLQEAFANKLILSYNLEFDSQALRTSFQLRGKYAWEAYTRFRAHTIKKGIIYLTPTLCKGKISTRRLNYGTRRDDYQHL